MRNVQVPFLFLGPHGWASAKSLDGCQTLSRICHPLVGLVFNENTARIGVAGGVVHPFTVAVRAARVGVPHIEKMGNGLGNCSRDAGRSVEIREIGAVAGLLHGRGAAVARDINHTGA